MRTAFLAAALSASLIAAPAGAQENRTDTAEAWFENCGVFMRVLAGGPGCDAEISYCVGQTEGIVSALGTGSQIGALAFGGLLAVQAKMNEKAVFELFKRTDPNVLLGICMPAGTQTSVQIETVYRHLEKNAAQRRLPVTAAFFDALRERFPCTPPAAAGQPQQQGGKK